MNKNFITAGLTTIKDIYLYNCTYSNVSSDFLKEFKNIVNWAYMSKYAYITPDIINDHRDMLIIDFIFINPRASLEAKKRANEIAWELYWK